MKRISKIIGLALATIVVGTGISFGFPKPSPVPMDWELNFKFQDLKRIKITVPGQKERTYWYMIYSVTNNTGQDVMFYPEITLVTDDLKVIPGMVDVDPEVFNAIKKQYKATYPWLEHPSKVIGKLLQGKDNTRDSVVIWPDFDVKASSIDVFVGGLSGEMLSVPNPMFVAGKSDPNKVPEVFVLRKTLVIHFALPTDPANRERINPSRKGQEPVEWVMR